MTLTRRASISMALLALGFCRTGAAGAEDAESRRQTVDRRFAQWDRPDSPGCALAVVKEGRVLYKRGYGMADLEHDVPIKPETVFHVASVSKQFTAMAILLLEDAGKLSLGDDVRKYVPELPDYGKTITVGDLMHHLSGLRDQWDLMTLAGWRENDLKTDRDVLALAVRQRSLNFEPRDEMLYCNTGYTLMGMIVKRVTGRSLRQYCKATIFDPLGMAATQFHDDHARIVKRRASAYLPGDDGVLRIAVPNFDTVGATGLFTTVEDLARWANNFHQHRVGSEAVHQKMLTPGTLSSGKQTNYAGGLVIGSYRGLKTIAHAGEDDGYRSNVLLFPEQRFAVICLCNLGTMSPTRQCFEVADIYLADAFPADQPPTPLIEQVSVPKEDLARLVGLYRNPDNGKVVSLVMKGDDLFIEGTVESQLTPTGASEFQAVGAPGTFSFADDGPDGRRRLHVRRGGAETAKYDAVVPPRYSDDDLKAFAGVYASAEVHNAYRVRVVGKRLVARYWRPEELRLQPTVADEFYIPGFMLRFERDDEGNVGALSISSGRCRNVRFAKRTAK